MYFPYPLCVVTSQQEFRNCRLEREREKKYILQNKCGNTCLTKEQEKLVRKY